MHDEQADILKACLDHSAINEVASPLLPLFVKSPCLLDQDALLNPSPLRFIRDLIWDARQYLGVHLARARTGLPAPIPRWLPVDKSMLLPSAVGPPNGLGADIFPARLEAGEVDTEWFRLVAHWRHWRSVFR